MKVRYRRKQGKGTLRIDGAKVKVKAGDVVEVEPGGIPEGFLDSYESLGPVPAPPEEEPPEAPMELRRIGKRNGGTFDLVNPVTDKKVSKKPLTRGEADALVDAGTAYYEREPGRGDE